ncbi:hypothetical protein A3F62_04995 [Candidatus Woesebacteria bacterium RIFCSPHIGHO2_12_FULL_44_11]|nr:MAG: hypothetical protein A3F62_04995 [Candidatus Woesebacteria bacterium RIFCSPHIGHO2_12_FULL_44_11]
MEQHAVPQQISSYQFRLVGDMTLKQFFQLAGGALISLLIYATGLPGLIKWPLIIFFALFGAALAFLPFEERPLSQWILAFFRSVYSPTLFTWQKKATPAVYFQPEPSLIGQETTRLPEVQEQTGLEQAEESFLTKISDLFKTGPTAPIAAQPQPVQPQIRIPAPPPIQFSPTEEPFKPRLIVEETIARASGDASQPLPTAVESKTTSVGETLVGEQMQNIRTAQFSDQAAPPTPPTQPNTIVGQVIDPEGGIVEGAILEVKDSFGRPTRALRSNKVGHFMVVTPLVDGTYELATEKEGLIFDPVSFEARGEIISPIAIRARGRERTIDEVAN